MNEAQNPDALDPFEIPHNSCDCIVVASAYLPERPDCAAVLVEAAKVRAYQERTESIFGLASSLLNEALGHLGSWAVEKSKSNAAMAADLPDPPEPSA